MPSSPGPWICSAAGNRPAAIHFISAALILLFVFVHVTEVILAGPINEVRSMLTGWYRVPEGSRVMASAKSITRRTAISAGFGGAGWLVANANGLTVSPSFAKVFGAVEDWTKNSAARAAPSPAPGAGIQPHRHLLPFQAQRHVRSGYG